MKLNSIQFLRAVAALLVVYDHSMMVVQIKYGTSWQQVFLHVKRFGCIGVDLFFVISGFIITLIASKYAGLSQGKHFLVKRFYRINPIYYLITLLFLPFVFLNSSTNQLLGTGNLTISSMLDSLIILPTSGHIYDPLMIAGWTLSFEWLFYLLFFFLIVFNVRKKVFLLMGIIVLLIESGFLFSPHDYRLKFFTNPMMLEFLLGCVICYFYLTFKQIPVYIGISCLLIGVAGYLYFIIFGGFGYIWYYKFTLFTDWGYQRALLWGLPSSLIVAGCVILEKNGQCSRIWNNPFSLLCGDASYSIYLVHSIVLNLLILLYKKTGLFVTADMMIWLQIIIVVAVSIFFYKLIEKPLLQFLNKGQFGKTSQHHKPSSEYPQKAGVV